MKRTLALALTSLSLLLALLIPPTAARADDLRVDVYDMGKADAMLITTPDGTRILIDCGTNKGGKALAARFAREGIDSIDTLIITHYDKDHVGGADKILEALAVRQVIMPVYDKESKQHAQFMEALDALPGIVLHPMEIGSELSMQAGDGTQLRITAAHQSSYGADEENDFSLCVRLTYGSTRFLFAGDAEAPRQAEIMEEGDVACDMLKVPYHGRLVSTSEHFLTQAAPQIACITDSEEEPASEVLLALLHELGTQVYRSGEDGDVTVLSDGKTVRIP